MDRCAKILCWIRKQLRFLVPKRRCRVARGTSPWKECQHEKEALKGQPLVVLGDPDAAPPGRTDLCYLKLTRIMKKISIKNIAHFLIFVCLASASGCKGSDVLFGLFGEHYTNGTTLEDKRANYNADIQKYENSTNR